MTDHTIAACDDCGRIRTADDTSYNPLQLIMGHPCGWYSGDDGEFCGQCMTRMFERANGRKGAS